MNRSYVLEIDQLEFVYSVAGLVLSDVMCCSFICGELWHDPVQCKVLKLWIKKCDDDSETSNWLAANTKAKQLYLSGLSLLSDNVICFMSSYVT